jgi:hypothetical protein
VAGKNLPINELLVKVLALSREVGFFIFSLSK